MEERRPGQHPTREERPSDDRTASRTTPRVPREDEPTVTREDRDRIDRARKREDS